MYEVTKASVVKNGRPIKVYNINVKTDNLEEVRQDILQRHLDECAQDVVVDLQYKNLTNNE